MAKRPTVSTISTGHASITALNSNFTALRDGFDNTLSRDGSTPNTMSADIDLNGNDITNVNTITNASGVDVVAAAAASATAAAASQAAAATSATAAASSQTAAASSQTAAASSATAAASSATSAAKAAIDTVMACEHPSDSGSCFSAAISSDGAYDVPEGLICGFPLMRMDDGNIEIKRDLSLSDFAKAKIQISVDELLSEKEAVKHLMK